MEENNTAMGLHTKCERQLSMNFDQLNKFNFNLCLELVFGIKISSAVFQYCFIVVQFSLSVTVSADPRLLGVVR